jgi:hypothetical protein
MILKLLFDWNLYSLTSAIYLFKMKKKKSIPVYFLVVVICSLFIVSCNEDSPVTSSKGAYQFDSARYNWTTGVAFSNNDQFFINWNGKKWSKEFSDPGGIFEIRNIGEDYYALSECSVCSFKFFRKGKS